MKLCGLMLLSLSWGACGDDIGPMAATAPALRSPPNHAYLGSVHVPSSLRPTFSWEANGTSTGTSSDEPVTYQVELTTDPAFVLAVASFTTAETSITPATGLAVSQSAPVGARYYWRVRACRAEGDCTPYSATWWINLGRSERDLNGDGFADVVVGEPDRSVGGRAHVYFGAAGDAFDSKPEGILESNGGRPFGSSVATGDFNNDGFADVVVGAPLDGSQNGIAVGRAYVYFGAAGTTFDTTADGTLADSEPGDSFGISVSSAGDVNGDGVTDVIVGRPYVSSGRFGLAGRAQVYLGARGATFDPSSDVTLTGPANDNQFGIAVAGAGDVNGDGFADLVVGADDDDTAGLGAGRAYLYFGGRDIDPDVDATLTGASSTAAQFGAAVGSAGDVNGDGFADVIIGAPHARHNDGDPRDGGHAFLYFGGAGRRFDEVADGTLSGDSRNDHFGLSLAAAGDVNRDGYADVIVGAERNGAGGYHAGRAYVYLGGAGRAFHPTAASALTGPTQESSLGSAVAGAGDVNGDGFPDLIMGAGPHDGYGPWHGVYLYFGAAGGGFDDAPRGVLEREARGGSFGYSLASLDGRQCVLEPPG